MKSAIHNSIVTLSVLILFSFSIGAAAAQDCKPFDFDVAPFYGVGDLISLAQTADMNGDGFTDVVGVVYNGPALVVIDGDAGGGFKPPRIFPNGTQYSRMIAIGDVNGDGRPDVVGLSNSALFNFNKLSTHLNDGNGGFLPPIYLDLPNNVITFLNVVTGDFNGDGKLDAAGVTENALAIFIGNGLGSFTLNTTVAWPGLANNIAVGRFNSDSFDDIALGSRDAFGPWELGIVFGRSNGFVIDSRYALTGKPAGIDIADVDMDGDQDILIAANYPYQNLTPQTYFVHPWLGVGNGSFLAGTKIQFPFETKGVIARDFDGDLKPDLAVNFNLIVGTIAGNGNGTFGTAKFWSVSNAIGLLKGDVNADGKQDIVYYSNTNTGGVSPLINEGAANFKVSRAVINGRRYLVTPDLNADSRPDSVTASSYELTVALTDQDGSLGPDQPTYEITSSLTGIGEGDFNGDGAKDVLTVSSSSPRGVSVLPGNGNGTLGSPVNSTLTSALASFVTGDFDQDGKTDVVGGDELGRIVYLRGSANGTFTMAPNFPLSLPNTFTRVSKGDYNNDGRLDLIVTNGASVAAWLANSNLGFDQQAAFAVSLENAVSGDWNDDGNLDVAGYTGGVVTRHLGNGNGTFGPAATRSISPSSFYGSLRSVDFNRDGFDDLVGFATAAPGNMVVMPSNPTFPYAGDPLYWAVQGFSGTYVSDLAAADFDQDGRTDVGITSWNRSRAVIRNLSETRPCLSVADASIVETNSGTVNATFNVSMSSPSASDVYFNYLIDAQTATAATDYQSVSGRVRIPAGETAASVVVPVLGDTIDEIDESFKVRLTGVVNASVLRGEAIGTIVDDDAEPTITISDVSATEGTALVFNYTLSNPSGKTIVFRWSTADGTATELEDYVSGNQIVSLQPGAVSGTIGVFVNSDSMFERDEELFVNLTEPGNVTIADGSGKGTILNNDPVPTVLLTSAVIVEGDWGPRTGNVAVQLTNPSYLPVSCRVITSDGTAGAWLDYEPTDNAVVIPPGQTVANSTVTINGDTINEPTETLFVNVYNVVNGVVNVTRTQFFITDDEPVANDFDRDGRTDISVFRPSERRWYILFSSNGFLSVTDFGLPDDVPVPGDFSGDDRTDIAVWRSTDGTWYTPIANRTQQFGQAGDLPAHGDFDNDARIDLAVFRPSDQNWYILRTASNTVTITRFGLPDDQPVVADYDGDGRSDIAVFRPSDGRWYVIQSSSGDVESSVFGLAGDQPVPGDFDGDGRSDIAVFRSGIWYVRQSSDGIATVVQFGLPGDKPVPGNYDGDNRADLAIYRDGVWWIWLSSTGLVSTRQFGLPTDIPIPFVSKQ